MIDHPLTTTRGQSHLERSMRSLSVIDRDAALEAAVCLDGHDLAEAERLLQQLRETQEQQVRNASCE